MKNYLVIISIILTIPMKAQTYSKAEERKIVAENYFNAFHNGNLGEVFKHLSSDCTVTYGKEQPQEANSFMLNSKAMIATLTFETKGYYVSPNSNKVLIDFSFTTPKNEETPSMTVDAVDIIEFNEQNQIIGIQVIPND